MAGHRKPAFGKLTKASRDRAARVGARDYGLSRRQVRERYNRGTYRPFAKRPGDRVPKHSPVRPVTGPDVLNDLRDRAQQNFDRQLGDTFKYNRSTVVNAIQNHASVAALRRMAGASEDELLTWASVQKRYGKSTPSWLRNMGWVDEKGKWNNVFWYH